MTFGGLSALGLQSLRLLNGDSSCPSILQPGWARTIPEGRGDGWRAVWGSKGRVPLQTMSNDTGFRRSQAGGDETYMTIKRPQLSLAGPVLWVVTHFPWGHPRRGVLGGA